jgi:ATP-dependent Clp protease ATP-binding subunit ClpB
LTRIVDIQLERVRRRLAERKITLELTEAAKEFLGNEGFDTVYCARPLKRAIQRRILDPLSLELLEGHFRDGDTILADVQDGRMVFSKTAAPAEAVPATV